MADTCIIRTKQFSEVFPYTYTIIRKLDRLQYHGVRWGNVRLGLSAVDDFGHKYYSSGIFEKEYKINPSAFEVKFRWTSQNKCTQNQKRTQRKKGTCMMEEKSYG